MRELEPTPWLESPFQYNADKLQVEYPLTVQMKQRRLHIGVPGELPPFVEQMIQRGGECGKELKNWNVRRFDALFIKSTDLSITAAQANISLQYSFQGQDEPQEFKTVITAYFDFLTGL